MNDVIKRKKREPARWSLTRKKPGRFARTMRVRPGERKVGAGIARSLFARLVLSAI